MSARDALSAPGVARVGRRGVLRGVLGAAALSAVGGPLSACSAESATAGGRLRLAAAGAALETLKLPAASAMTDYIAMFGLFDPLVVLRGDRIENRLAAEIEPNGDATEYTVTLRSGVQFHDGRPCTATDVKYSLSTLADPKTSPNYAQFYGDLDVANIKVVDEQTVRVPLHRPRADFVEASLATFSLVFPDGTSEKDWEKGIGTGPFQLVSSGDRARVLRRNQDYWDDVAKLDEVEILSITKAETRMKALRGGKIDYAHAVSPADAAAAGSSVRIVRGGPSNSSMMSLHMNVNQKPFDNPDVRLAIKLLVDRPAMIDTVLFGRGTIGNDVVGQGLAGFNEDLPQRERNISKAKALLEKAGVGTVTLHVAELAPGMTDAARLFAEQATEAGLTVELKKEAADSYFSDMQTVLNTPFQAMFWVNRPAATHLAGFTGSRGGFNVTGIGGTKYDQMLDDMQATVDDARRQRALEKLQRHLWEYGGDVVWGLAEQLDATAPGVSGIKYTQGLPRLDLLSLA